MTAKATVAISAVKENTPCSEDFSSATWFAYFEQNKASKVTINFPNNIVLQNDLRTPLIRSLQRFQIGETGEGKHLRSYAKNMHDEIYERCIDLFIKEEQSHARILAEMIGAMDGTLLNWHWTDLAFITLRRMMRLKTELFILLIAEIVGKSFYLLCSRQIPHERMSNAFSLMVLDEIAHLRFHALALNQEMKAAPQWFRWVVFRLWSALFYAACFVFIADHLKTLTALNSSKEQFLKDCRKEFRRAASLALSLDLKTHE
jgi:hypothetical protein